MGLIAALLLLPSLLATGTAMALKSDRNQPMTIEADRAELDDERGVSTYSGKVRVTQGSMILQGDTITVHARDGDIGRVIVEGRPARYRQRPDGKDQDVVARARRMEYSREPEQVVLVGDVEVRQGGDLLRGERIVYDIARDRIQASGGEAGERVRITLQPRATDSRSPEKSQPTPGDGAR